MTDQYQYLRKSQLYIGDATDGLNVSELRFSFTVTRGDSQTPNTARISVYNMAPETAARIQKEFMRIVLTGGYATSSGTLFDGTVTQTRYGRTVQSGTQLDISAADGDNAYNFACVNTTLAAGSTAKDHVRVASEAMGEHGVGVGYTAGLQSNPLPRGKVMFGMARDALACTARNTNTIWSIQDGKLQIVPETSYMPGEIHEINADTGMVGLPSQTQNGIQVKTLMNPRLKVGTLVHLSSEFIQPPAMTDTADAKKTVAKPDKAGAGKPAATTDKADAKKTAPSNRLAVGGFYYVMQLEHKGDTRGTDWYTTLTCIAADPTVIGSQDLLNRPAFGTTAPVPGSVDSNG